MSTSWLRLWHDMPNDPKWRAIARKAGRSVPEVLAVYVHMLTNASANADARGELSNWSDEDISAALDMEPEHVTTIREAMLGKTLDGDRLIGFWDRQKVSDGENNGRLAASEWRVLRQLIFVRDDFTCQYCGERGGRLECDHVHPVSKGGTHDETNLVTACFSCNRSKRDKSVEQWRGVA